MIVRNLVYEDIPAFIKLVEKHPDFSQVHIDKSVVDKVAVGKDGSVKAYGIVLPLAEAVFIPDIDASNREKVEAVKLLLQAAIEGTKRVGVRQLHCFIQNSVFAEIMIKHFNFEPCVGQALVLNLDKN